MLKEEFTSLTGIKVEWELLPLDRVLTKTVADTLQEKQDHQRYDRPAGCNVKGC